MNQKFKVVTMCKKYTVTLILAHGNEKRPLRKGDFDEQIEALKKASDGKPLNGIEQTLVFDIVLIVEAIKKQLKL